MDAGDWCAGQCRWRQVYASDFRVSLLDVFGKRLHDLRLGTGGGWSDLVGRAVP